MNFRLILLSLIVVFIGTSCQKEVYNEREKSLFIGPYFGYDVSLDSIQTLGDLIEFFDKTYCENENKVPDKWPILYFDLNEKRLVNPQHGKNIVALGIEPSPCSDVVLEYDFSQILEIVKDGYNLEVEDVRIEPDSLSPYISKQYLNFGKSAMYSKSPVDNGIWLISNKDDKLSNLNKYIAQIIDGYVIMARQFSKSQFHKQLDELDEKEFAQLKMILSFHLSFKYSDEEPKIINELF